jgi:hypothetical protein
MRALRKQIGTQAASVGQSRAAARRRREQRRSFLCSDDDGGGSRARLREQQGPDKSVVKNTSDHGGLMSLSGQPEF